MRSCLKFAFYLQSNAKGIQILGIVLSTGFCWDPYCIKQYIILTKVSAKDKYLNFYKMEQKPSMIKDVKKINKKMVTLLMCNYS